MPGNCFAYALADPTAEPLLFEGATSKKPTSRPSDNVRFFNKLLGSLDEHGPLTSKPLCRDQIRSGTFQQWR
jgi:hypothetical protein